MRRVAVLGLAVAGTAVVRAFAERGVEMHLADDATSREHRDLALDVGATLFEPAHDPEAHGFLDGVDMLVPAPGVPPHHPVVVAARSKGIPVRSEIDVAYEWEMSRPGGPRPMLGVTGTDGKTTTTMLVAAVLGAHGIEAAEVGNTDLPFMAALGLPVDAFVIECSSFRLEFSEMFRCDSSVWLNLAPDHLDWHGSLGAYRRAKARLWDHVRPNDVVVAPVADVDIVAEARASGGRVVTFGADSGDYCVRNGHLSSPRGPLCPVESLWRTMPHDITNSLAACAVAVESGLVREGEGIVRALSGFVPARHRIELVADHGGTRWFDDSKATSPHAALTAIRSLPRIVLIAGGRNKDLDLGQMASEPRRMAGVVAIGDDAALIEHAFAGVCPVVRAGSMAEAVSCAASMVEPGVDVLLSPGCTSYDWYDNYGQRGDDFAAQVRRLLSGDAMGPGA